MLLFYLVCKKNPKSWSKIMIDNKVWDPSCRVVGDDYMTYIQGPYKKNKIKIYHRIPETVVGMFAIFFFINRK